MTTEERLNRWRLILGRESDERFAPMGAAPLSAEELLMDQALAAIYGGRVKASPPADAVPETVLLPRILPNGLATCARCFLRIL